MYIAIVQKIFYPFVFHKNILDWALAMIVNGLLCSVSIHLQVDSSFSFSLSVHRLYTRALSPVCPNKFPLVHSEPVTIVMYEDSNSSLA